MLLGADASLRKPFTEQELHDVVNSLLSNGGDDIDRFEPTDA
jgi:DNA-binding response OmpR family regulator